MFFVIKWSLFEMNFFKSLIFVNNRNTWSIPMSKNSRIFGSIVCPFIFVYLGWFRENGVINESKIIFTVFSDFYKMKIIPFLGNPSNIFFQLLLLIVSILTSLNMLNKFLVSIRCSNLQFGIPEISNDTFESGKEKLIKRKKLIKRAYKQSLQKTNNNIEKIKQQEGLIEFMGGFNKQSKFHSYGVYFDNESNENDNNENNLKNLNNSNCSNYSSLSITQDKKYYTLKDIGKRMESISEIFTKYDTRSPFDCNNGDMA